MADETDKDARDSALRYSQYDLDAATKPLHSEIERLREALRKYGSHVKQHCQFERGAPCTCGLAALLHEEPEK